MIGVMSLITVLSVMNGFEQQLKGKLLGVMPHALVTEANSVSGDVPQYLFQHPEVEQVAPLSRSEAILQSSRALAAVDMLGISPDAYEPLADYIINGSISVLKPRDYNIVIGRTLASQLGVTVGDKVRVMVTSASQYTPLGRIPSQRNFTVAGIFASQTDVDNQQVLVNIDDAGRLLRYNSGEFTGWRLFVRDPFSVPAMAKLVEGTPQQWSDWRQQRGELFQAVKMEKNMMSLMLGLIIAVAAFNIISSLIMVVMEKQSEVAILKTQGMRQGQIQAIFMFQGVMSGLIGSAMGGVLGILLALNLNTILSIMGATTLLVGGHLTVLLQPLQIISVLSFSILLSFAATLFPAYRASMLQPAETLRYE